MWHKTSFQTAFLIVSKGDGLKVRGKEGYTLTEALVSSFLIASASVVVYTGAVMHVRTIRTATLMQEAQNLAYSTIWAHYALPFDDLVDAVSATPASSRMGDKGVVRIAIIPDPADTGHKTIVCQIWAPPMMGFSQRMQSDSAMLVEYRLDRYRTE